MSADLPKRTGGVLAPLIRQLPALPDGWRYERLDQLVEPRGICYGVVQPGQPVSGGVPMLRVNNIRDRTVVRDDVVRVAPSIDAKHRRSRLLGGEVLLTIVGANFGEAAIAPHEVVGWNVARAIAVIPVATEHDPYWICFALQSPLVRHFIHSWATTTAQPTLNLSDVAELPIPIPPRAETATIAGLLRRLDDKLELNRRMNRTLEELAAALFRSWFVDFDPVVSKAAGRTPFGLAPKVAALFPAIFTDSELGPIPHGWHAGKVRELANMSRGGINPGDFPTEIFDHYSLPAFDEGRQPQAELGSTIKSNKFPVPADCVLVSKLNPRIPRVWMPGLTGERRAICSTEFLVMTPKRPIAREFLCCLFSSDAFISEFATFVTGTSGSHQRVKPESLLGMDAIIPPAPLVERFTEIVRPWLAQAAHNIRESHTLVALRDTLLPKLLSGELRLKDAEKKVATVV